MDALLVYLSLFPLTPFNYCLFQLPMNSETFEVISINQADYNSSETHSHKYATDTYIGT